VSFSSLAETSLGETRSGAREIEVKRLPSSGGDS
jgi:hypothetical protein